MYTQRRCSIGRMAIDIHIVSSLGAIKSSKVERLYAMHATTRSVFLTTVTTPTSVSPTVLYRVVEEIRQSTVLGLKSWMMRKTFLAHQIHHKPNQGQRSRVYPLGDSTMGTDCTHGVLNRTLTTTMTTLMCMCSNNRGRGLHNVFHKWCKPGI